VTLCIGNLKFGEMEDGEMKRNTSNWSNFCLLPRRAGLLASAELSCYHCNPSAAFDSLNIIRFRPNQLC